MQLLLNNFMVSCIQTKLIRRTTVKNHELCSSCQYIGCARCNEKITDTHVLNVSVKR